MRKPDRFELQRWGWEAALFALVTLMVSYTWMFGDISVPNERSRVYLTVALVDDGVVEIDEPLKRFGRIYDLAKRENRFYSDKAPGSSILAAPIYWVATQLSPREEWKIWELINLFRTWLMIPLTLVAFFFLRRLLEVIGLDPPVVDIASLAWILGTAAFHYGAAFFGHQIVAAALIVALYCIVRAEDCLGNPGRLAKWCLAAGVALGVAGMTEYQAVIGCALLTGYVAFGDARMRNNGLPAIIVGAAPFAALLLWYNDAAFGGPFELSYHYLADPELQRIHGQGIAGVTFPTWEYFSGSMFSLHRGLLGTSPLFVFALWGLWVMWDEGDRRLAGVIGLTALYFVAFVSSSNMWYAGWGFGPRLLVPGMTLWTVPVAIGVQSAMSSAVGQGFARALAALQIAYVQVVIAYFPEPPPSAENPIYDVVGVMREQGLVSPNLGQSVLGLEATTSITVIGVLTAIAVVIVLVRGTLLLSWTSRAIIAGAVAATFLFGATALTIEGPTWDDDQRVKWVKLVDGWRAKQARL